MNLVDSNPVVVVRVATSEDAPGILNCLHSAFEPFRAQYSPEGFGDTILNTDTIQQRLSLMRVFVAVCSGEIVGTIGCCIVGAEEGHLRGMAVAPGWQGSGAAQQLLECAETELRHKNCKRISLDTTQPLQRAIRFYERHGFRPSGRTTDFFGMPLFEYVKDLPH